MTPTQPQTPAVTNRIDGLRPDAPARAAWGAFGVGRTTLMMTNADVPRVANLMTGEGPDRADRTLTIERVKHQRTESFKVEVNTFEPLLKIEL